MEKITSYFTFLSCSKKSELSYYIYFTILTITQFIPWESNFKMLLILLSLPFLIYKFMVTSYSLKELMSILLIGVIIIISTYLSRREGLLITFATIVGFKDIKIRNVLKLYLFIGGICFLSVSIYYLFLSSETTSKESMRYFFSIPIMIKKNTLGYAHANLTYGMLSSLLFCYCYLQFSKMNIKRMLVILVIGLFYFYLTFSRTGLIILLSGLLLCYLMNHRPSKVYSWIPIVMIVTSFITTYAHKYFPNKILESFNLLLSNRLMLGHEFIDFFEPRLFGQYVDDITGYAGYYLKCDNSFLLTLSCYGILIFIVLCILTYGITRKKILAQDVFIISIFYIYGFAESFFLTITVNFSLLLFSSFLYKCNDEGAQYDPIHAYRFFLKERS